MALRAAVVQAALAMLVAAGFGLQGASSALSAATTGGALALGSYLGARVAFSGGVQAAGGAVARLLVAIGIKWSLAVAGVLMALAVWHLPPLPALAGLAIGLVAQPVAMHYWR